MIDSTLHEKLLEALTSRTNDSISLVGVKDLELIEISEKHLIRLARLASVGELVSGVAHEINNQLATAIGYSELLLRGDVAEPAREYLHLISGQTQRASRIVEDLLFLARRGTSVKSLLDVREPLERALRIRSYGLRVNNIRVAKELSQELGRDSAADGRTAPAGLRHPSHRTGLATFTASDSPSDGLDQGREHRLFRHLRRVHTSLLRCSSLRSTLI